MKRVCACRNISFSDFPFLLSSSIALMQLQELSFYSKSHGRTMGCDCSVNCKFLRFSFENERAHMKHMHPTPIGSIMEFHASTNCFK